MLGVALSAMLAGCFFTDLSALSNGGVDDGAGRDAGMAPEAAADTSTGADAADAADAQAKFCATAGPHTLCDDFDTTADAGWTQFATYGGGTGAKDLVDFVSPPAAFALTTPALAPDGGEAWLFPVLAVPLATKHVRVEAKVRACSGAGEYVFLSVNSLTTTDDYGAIDVGIQRTAAGTETYLTVKHDAFSKTFSLGPALPSTRFTRLVLDTDIDKTNGSVKLSIDGTVVVDAKNVSTDQSGNLKRRAAWAGLYAYEAPACTARIDDVAIDAQ